MKKRTIIGLSLLGAIILVVGVAYGLTRPQIKAARSVEQIAEQMYVFSFEGDDGVDKFLSKGGASSPDEVVKLMFGCSFITAPDEQGHYLTARNFDWPNGQGDIVIVKNRPKNGYASIATTQLAFLGFGDDFQPMGSMVSRMMLFACIYVPLDGFNEKGLFVADLVAGDQDVTNQQTDRTDVTTTTAIRVLLDKAATTDEAVALLAQWDMHSDAGFAHHLAISDAEGHSVVVEWVDDEMVVAPTAICTNHYLADTRKKNTSLYFEDSHRRYDLLQHTAEAYPTMSEETVTEAIAAVASKDLTRWTMVYDREKEEVTYYQYADFTHPVQIKILK